MLRTVRRETGERSTVKSGTVLIRKPVNRPKILEFFAICSRDGTPALTGTPARTEYQICQSGTEVGMTPPVQGAATIAAADVGATGLAAHIPAACRERPRG